MSTTVDKELNRSIKTINEANDDSFQKNSRTNLYSLLSIELNTFKI